MLSWLAKQIKSGDTVDLEVRTDSAVLQGGVVDYDAVGVVIINNADGDPYMVPWNAVERVRVHIG